MKTRSSFYKLPYGNPNMNLDLLRQKKIFLLITFRTSLKLQKDFFFYPSDSKTIILASFPAKSLNFTVLNLYLQKMSTLTIAKFTISTRTDFKFQTRVKKLKAIMTCSAFTPDSRYHNSLSKLNGNVYCPNGMCSENFVYTEKRFSF